MIIDGQLWSSQLAKGAAEKDLVMVPYWFFK
jgi:hypothetical protein